MAIVAVVCAPRGGAAASGAAGMVSAGGAAWVFWPDGTLEATRPEGSKPVRVRPLSRLVEAVADGAGVLAVGEERGAPVALRLGADGGVLQRWTLPAGRILAAAVAGQKRWVLSAARLFELGAREAIDRGEAPSGDGARVYAPGEGDAVVCTSGGMCAAREGWRSQGRRRRAPLACGRELVEVHAQGVAVRFTAGELAGQQTEPVPIPPGATLGCGFPGQVLAVQDRVVAMTLDGHAFRGGRRVGPPATAVALVAGQVALLGRDGRVRFQPHPLLVPPADGGSRGGLMSVGGGFLLWHESGLIQIGSPGLGWRAPVPVLVDGAEVMLRSPLADAGTVLAVAVPRSPGGGARTSIVSVGGDGRIVSRWVLGGPPGDPIGQVARAGTKLLATAGERLLELRPGGAVVTVGQVERGAQLVQGLADETVECVPGFMTKNQPRLARCRSRERGWSAEGTWGPVPLGCGRYLVEQGFRVAAGERQDSLVVRDARTGEALVSQARPRGRLLGCGAPGELLWDDDGGVRALKLPDLAPLWRRRGGPVAGAARAGGTVAVVKRDGGHEFLAQPSPASGTMPPRGQ
jgi:hypothetical protein